MIQPNEMKLDLPMTVSKGVVSTTSQVWDILVASRDGDLPRIMQLVKKCPELIYAQYNYTPPIHFAVREGHVDVVEFLLRNGALDPSYIIYPFKDSLLTIAEDRNHDQIAALLKQYLGDPSQWKYKGDNGEIHYQRSELELEFEKAVDQKALGKVEQILQANPHFAKDETFFWGEGILMMPAKENNVDLMELLMRYGAKVPPISKWAQFYYFEDYNSAAFLLEKGMNPDHMTWHHVTLLHDMAQKGDIPKAKLLIEHGAQLDPIEEEYQSTPLGFAARWGQLEMVEFLLERGANPSMSGASWSSPLAWAKKKEHSQIERLLLNF